MKGQNKSLSNLASIKPNFEPQSQQVDKKRKDHSLEVHTNDERRQKPNLIEQDKNQLSKNQIQLGTKQNSTNQTQINNLNSQTATKQFEFNLKALKQNQTVTGSSINFSQFFRQKNIYQPLNHVNSNFMYTIQKGVVQVETVKQQISPRKQNALDINEQQDKIKQIKLKKSQIIQQLKQLYEQEKQAIFQRKLRGLNKKSRHHSSFHLKNQDNRLTSKDSTQLAQSKRKLFQKISSTKSTKQILQANTIGQQRPLKQEKQKSCERSNFTSQEKQKIVQIIKKKNQKEKEQIQKTKQLAERIKSQQEQNMKRSELELLAEKQKRKQRALQRFMNTRKNKTQNMRRSNYFKTQPSELKDNEFCLSPDLSLSQISQQKNKASRSLKRKYIYLVNQETDLQKENQRAKFEEFLLQKRRQQTKTDFLDIRVHLKNHARIKNEQAQLQKEKIQSYRISQKERIREIREKYGFLTKIKQNMFEEERLSIEKYQEDLNRKMTYQKKIKDYFQSIKNKSLVRSKSSIVQNRAEGQSSPKNFSPVSQKNEHNQESKSSQKISKNLNKSRHHTQLIQGKKQSPKSNKLPIQNIQASRKSKATNELVRQKKIQKSPQQKMEKQMMKLLRNEQSSISEIKKALKIFQTLDYSFWKESSKHSGKIKKQAGLINFQKNDNKIVGN